MSKAATHRPFVKVFHVRKRSRRHMTFLYKGQRVAHLLSDGESRHVLKIESLLKTIEIFEQYPLWDLEQVIRLANEMGIQYPTDKMGEAYVMSTDLLCLELDPDTLKPRLVAYSCKPTKAIVVDSTHPISVRRTLQKLALEEEYWRRKGVPFNLITDFHVSRQAAKNLKWARSVAKFKNEFIMHEEEFIERFIDRWKLAPLSTIRENLFLTAERCKIDYSTAFSLFRWGIWTHQIAANLDKEIHVFRPLDPMGCG